MKDNKVRLAVYGTLKSTHANHSLLGKEATVIAQNVRIPACSLYEVDWFPGVVKDPDGPGVVCEIVEIPARNLGNIDAYEGYVEDNQRHSFFTREVVTLENGEDVLMYFYNRPVEGYMLVPSGIWENK